MKPWLERLRKDLTDLRAQGLFRQRRCVDRPGRRVCIDGQSLINLASNDYLALATDPRLVQAAVTAIEAYGTGSGASALVSGHLTIHRRVERRFAQFKGAQAALLCPTGYMANLAVMTALAGPGDLICLDKLVHASLHDAARASGAEVRVFPHRQTHKLCRLLERSRAKGGIAGRAGSTGTRFIVTDSVFSMDGDLADLPTLCDVAQSYDAIFMVDEAHATGVLGPTGAGLVEAQGVADRVDVVVSTAGKALGGAGAVITSCPEIIETIVNRARSYIYTTACPAATAATIDAALDVVRDEPWRRADLACLAMGLRRELRSAGWLTDDLASESSVAQTPIVPVIVGQAETAMALSAHLKQAGFFAPAMRPPTVARGTSRIRLSLRADLRHEDLDRLVAALAHWRS